MLLNEFHSVSGKSAIFTNIQVPSFPCRTTILALMRLLVLYSIGKYLVGSKWDSLYLPRWTSSPKILDLSSLPAWFPPSRFLIANIPTEQELKSESSTRSIQVLVGCNKSQFYGRDCTFSKTTSTHCSSVIFGTCHGAFCFQFSKPFGPDCSSQDSPHPVYWWLFFCRRVYILL